MNIIIMFLVFFVSIFVHEITHILLAWWFNKQIPTMRINKGYVKITPKKLMTNSEKSIFLGVPIITGMFSFIPFFFLFPTESSLAMIGYLISCGKDFYELIKLEVRNK